MRFRPFLPKTQARKAIYTDISWYKKTRSLHIHPRLLRNFNSRRLYTTTTRYLSISIYTYILSYLSLRSYFILPLPFLSFLVSFLSHSFLVYTHALACISSRLAVAADVYTRRGSTPFTGGNRFFCLRAKGRERERDQHLIAVLPARRAGANDRGCSGRIFFF